MTVWNNEKFLRPALEPLIGCKHVDHIVVVEGAWSPHSESQRSSDSTMDILNELKPRLSHVLLWDQMPIENYRGYQCERHRELVRNAINHPYYDGLALQQQMLARDWGLRTLMEPWEHYDSWWQVAGDNSWLWIVDSDEVYLPEQIDQMAEFLEVVGADYDFFTIQGKNFYFNGKQYHNEWFRRLFKIKEQCFFSDDNSLEIPGELYSQTMNIPPDIVEFFHYSYVGEFRVKKKLEMWQHEPVEQWWEKHKNMMGGGAYDGSSVHLFGGVNPGYSDYRLLPFEGRHPTGVAAQCEDCGGSGQCRYCQSAGGRCGCGGKCEECAGQGEVINAS
jgi:hypothetical protein